MACSKGAGHGTVGQFGYAGLRGPEFGSEPNWLGAYVGTAERESIYRSFVFNGLRYLAFPEDPGPDFVPTAEDMAAYFERSQSQHDLFSASSGDISAFTDRGGKLLIYHGWRDQSVAPEGTLDYLELLRAQETSPDAVRAYMVPGLNHCRGGVGPTQVDWLQVMMDWVETGAPPEELRAKDDEGDTRQLTPLSP